MPLNPVLYGRERLPVMWMAPRIVLISAALCCGCSETIESRYSNTNEAIRSGAIARGWVPDILPKDAVDIREFHKIDTGQTWGCFITPGGLQQVRTRLLEVGAKQEEGTLPPEAGGPPWWPTIPPDEKHSLPEAGGRVVRIRLNVATREVCFSREIA